MAPARRRRLARSTDAHLGKWSLRILAESGADGPVGITVPDVTLTKAQGRYPPTPGCGRPRLGPRSRSACASRTASRSPARTPSAGRSSRPAGRSGPSTSPAGPSRLALEITARDLPSGGYRHRRGRPAPAQEPVLANLIGLNRLRKEGRCVGSGFLRSWAPRCWWGCSAPALPPPSRTTSTSTSLVACGTVQATGWEMPKDAKLDVRIQNAANDATLHKATVTTNGEGALALKTKVDLVGVRTGADVGRRGRRQAVRLLEMTIPGECPLPFTGPARAPALTGLAVGLILAGTALVAIGPPWTPPRDGSLGPAGKGGAGAPSCAWCRRPGRVCAGRAR